MKDAGDRRRGRSRLDLTDRRKRGNSAMRRRSIKARESSNRGYFQRRDVGRQKAREIQKARVFPATWPSKIPGILRSDVDRRRGSPRERRRSREIEER